MPLELPTGTAFEVVVACSAVRLFVQQARMVRPGFTLDAATQPMLRVSAVPWTGFHWQSSLRLRVSGS